MSIIIALVIIIYVADRIRQHNDNYNEAQRIKKLRKQREYDNLMKHFEQKTEVQKEDDSRYAHLFAPSNKKGRK